MDIYFTGVRLATMMMKLAVFELVKSFKIFPGQTGKDEKEIENIFIIAKPSYVRFECIGAN